MAEETRYGAHSVTVEGTDTLLLRVVGELHEDEATAIMEAQQAFSAGKSYVLLMVDMTGFRGMTAAARRAFATRGVGGPPRLLACFGGSFRGKVFLDLIVKAASLLEGERSRVRIRWLKDEAEARACLDEMRPHFAGPGDE
jgi:hypothetical protein